MKNDSHRSTTRRNLERTLLLLCLALLLAGAIGCQQLKPTPPAEAAIVAAVWPTPPARPRIRWVREIRGPADVGARPGFFRRLLNWVSGLDEARLARPHGVAVDATGRIWVTDPGMRRVHVLDPVRHSYMPLPGKDDPALFTPIAVTHGPDGTAYVSDSTADVIRRFDARGRDLGAWNAGGTLKRPTGLAYDTRNNLLWVADTGNHRLLALEPGGEINRIVGGRGREPGRFNFPTHLGIDRDGRLLVADTLNFRVQILTSEGELLTTLGRPGDGPGALSKPKGLGFDPDGNVYVVDALFDNVQIFDDEGRLLLYFGDHGSGSGEFWLPAGLWIDDGGQIYVADSYNKRIQVFQYLAD